MLNHIKVHGWSSNVLQRSELFSSHVFALGSHVVFETKGARTSTALYALTHRILPHTCVTVCNMVACGSYGRPWLRNLQCMMPSSACIIVGPRAVHGAAIERSAQERQRCHSVDLTLPKRSRESTNDCGRSSSTCSAWSHDACGALFLRCITVFVAYFIVIIA